MEDTKQMPQGEALERELAKAYRLYQENIRETGDLIFQLTKGARECVPEGELLEIALKALERCRIPEL